MRKRTLVVVIMLLMMTILVSCKKEKNKDNMVEVVDFVNDTVLVPKNPKKVAVVARSAVDMLVAFGLGESIDGVYKTIFDNPWSLYLYPELENYYSYEYNENYETFYSRGIDLIIAPKNILQKT